jgi:hypothetical protein
VKRGEKEGYKKGDGKSEKRRNMFRSKGSEMDGKAGKVRGEVEREAAKNCSENKLSFSSS